MEMIFYEFYLQTETEGDKLIGILPERRNDPERTDLESIMKWPSMVFGNTVDLDNVYFVIVDCWENEGMDLLRRREIPAASKHFINKERSQG